MQDGFLDALWPQQQRVLHIRHLLCLSVTSYHLNLFSVCFWHSGCRRCGHVGGCFWWISLDGDNEIRNFSYSTYVSSSLCCFGISTFSRYPQTPGEDERKGLVSRTASLYERLHCACVCVRVFFERMKGKKQTVCVSATWFPFQRKFPGFVRMWWYEQCREHWETPEQTITEWTPWPRLLKHLSPIWAVCLWEGK